ncbi:hypothetical protein [Caballeronia sp. J97]|uniref:hypothetical protein n=1 Tax=Caballeronia sp. J97 TaxID=2805429 RepID=UPI002AB2C144|nr:hypothetical protein [Caballeronia sp. J97]
MGTSSVTIDNVSYGFAGQVPNGTVSIGSAGNERTLTNLAAGRVVNGGLTMSPTLSSPDVGGVVGVTYTFN